MNILRMGRDELLALRPEELLWRLSKDEVMHIAKTLGAFWSYDYEALKKGKPGMHALLKSGRHSDGFFVLKILLASENILRIFANQMVMMIRDARIPRSDYVAGVPDGATSLGRGVAKFLGAREALLKKVDGRITLETRLRAGDSILLIEDFCTRGTGFAEAVASIKRKQPEAHVMPYNPVIINRGGLKTIFTEECGDCTILPLVEWQVQDWDPTDDVCSLCQAGSVPIKPKATDANWEALNASQR